MAPNLNVGLVGCGYVANGHLQAWRRISNARLAAVSDLNENLAKETARIWRIPHYYVSFQDLIESNDVDVVDICTPPQTHARIASQAISAGHRVLIEKPMTMTLKDAQSISDSQRKMTAKAGVIHNWLFEPPVLKATSMVNDGMLGKLHGLSLEALSTKNDSMAMNESHWCHKLPGGRFSEMLAHPIYLIRRFLGEGGFTDLHVSKIGEYSWMKSDELCASFDVDGKLGRVYVSFNAPREGIFLTLYGTEAILRLDVINATLNLMPRRNTSRFSKGSDVFRQAFQLLGSLGSNSMRVASGRWLSGHETCIKLFAESVMNDSEVPVSIEEGMAVVRILEEMCERIHKQESGSV